MGKGFGRLTFTFEDKNFWVLGKILEYQAERRGDSPFLQYMEEPSLSFREVNEIVNRVAHGLIRLGVKKDDKVLIMLPNCLEYIYVWFGANKIGAVEVPINNAYKGYFFEHVANNSEAKFMVLNEEFVEVVKFSKDNLQHLETVILVGESESAYRQLKDLGKFNVVHFNEMLSDDTSNPEADVRYYDLGAIMYTSGTTGPSKGVMMPHAHLYVFSESLINAMKLNENDTYYTCLPFFHGNAQVLTLYPCLISGVKVVIYPRFSASEWVEHMIKHGITVTNFLGVMMEFIFKQPPKPEDSQVKLKAIFAVPTPAALVDRFKERFKVPRIIEGYGMTEIGMVTFMPYDEFRAGSCGKALDEWYELKIVDPETDEELPPGEIGELIVRHKLPWILNVGYFGMPDKTVEAYRNLWFHTGDALKKDEDGYFYFIDRIKDAIRRRGENISSYEVEKVVNEHPAVLESAAIAIKSEVAGGEDEVKICVVLKEGERLDPEELIRWCDDRMPYFAVPRYVEFVKELPKTPNLKVQKAKLREMSADMSNTWDRVKAGVKLKDEVRREKEREERRKKKAKK